MQDRLDDLLNDLSRILPERMHQLARACGKSFLPDVSSHHDSPSRASPLPSTSMFPPSSFKQNDPSGKKPHSSSSPQRLSAYTFIQELSDSISLLPYAFTFFFTHEDVHQVIAGTTAALFTTLEERLSTLPVRDHPYIPFFHPDRDCADACCAGYPSRKRMNALQREAKHSFWKILEALPEEARLPPTEENVRVETLTALILTATDLMATAYAQPLLFTPPRKLVGSMRLLINNLGVLLDWYNPASSRHPFVSTSSPNTIPASLPSPRESSQGEVLPSDASTIPDELQEDLICSYDPAYAAWIARHEAVTLRSLPQSLMPLANAYLSFLVKPSPLPPSAFITLGRLKPQKTIYLQWPDGQLISLRDRLEEDLAPFSTVLPPHQYDLLVTTAVILHLAAASPMLAEDLHSALMGRQTTSFTPQETYPPISPYPQLPSS